MSKTVDVSLVVTRNGLTTTQNFPAMSYASFVAMQSACAGALSQLQSWGTARVAEMAAGKKGRSPAGEDSLRMELRANHGGGGTSEVVVGYTGISAKDADDITSIMVEAANSTAGK